MPIVRRRSSSLAFASLALILFGCAGPATTVRQDPSCLKETGSRISTGAANCTGFGRAYSGDDINRTGSATTAGSLRLLDPSLTVH